jgi:hypothetical protein
MRGMTFTLSEYPFEMVELACEACERRGRLRKARLIQEHGPDMGIARLRDTLIRCRTRLLALEMLCPPHL